MQEKVSVIIPTMEGRDKYLPYLIKSLSRQLIIPVEVIIVAKNRNITSIEKECSDKGFKFSIIAQKNGYVTNALNIGMREAKGNLVICTDDDAIVPTDWTKKYLKLHEKFGSQVACVSSRDQLFDLNKRIVTPSYDDSIINHFYRKMVRPWYERPLSSLRLYKQGVYLTEDLQVVVGPMIPNSLCYSFPFRGVNVCFKHEALCELQLPEHPELKRGIGWEAYFGLQLFLKGYLMAYVPDNPVLHIIHESISRPSNDKKSEVKYESALMRSLFFELFRKETGYSNLL